MAGAFDRHIPKDDAEQIAAEGGQVTSKQTVANQVLSEQVIAPKALQWLDANLVDARADEVQVGFSKVQERAREARETNNNFPPKTKSQSHKNKKNILEWLLG